MSGKMEMSLDDIIKQNRGNRRGARRGGSGSRGGSSRGGGGGGGGGGAGRRGLSRGGVRKPGGPVMRGRSRGGIARSRSSFGRPNVKRSSFLGGSGSGGSGGSPRKFGGSDTTKLIVSNLDFGVTDSDILELFSEFGPLKSAGVHYDRSGRSLGSADLIFERRADAIKAMKQYNGVPLDGREMNIQLATSEIPGAGARGSRPSGSGFKRSPMNRTRRGGGSPSKRGGAAAGKRGAGGKPGPGGRQAKKQPTAEELDAELEEYVKSKVSSTEGA